MAHFGVRKAKTILTVAGVAAAVGGAFLVPSGDANAVKDVKDLNQQGFQCKYYKEGSVYEIWLGNNEAIKTAFVNPGSFYDNDQAPCYSVFEQNTAPGHSLSFYIESGTYNIDERVSTRESVTLNIGAGKNVTLNASAGNGVSYGGAQGLTWYPRIEVAEGGSLTMNGGNYNMLFLNRGTTKLNSVVLIDSDVDNYRGNMTFDGVTYTSSDTVSRGNISNSTESTMTIKSGTYRGYANSYNINLGTELISNSGDLIIEGGNFENHATHASMGATVNGQWRPYKGEPHGIIDTAIGHVLIKGGSFKADGTVISAGNNENMTIDIKNGYYEGDYIFSFYTIPESIEESIVKVNISNGVFNSNDSFSLVDAKNISDNQGGDGNGVAAGVYKDSTGRVRANMCTGNACSAPFYILPNNNMTITGGTFSDGDNITPAPGHSKVETDTDFDGDGNNDVRVVPGNRKKGTDMSIPEGETQKPSDADLGGKKPEDLEWGIEKGKDFCTVNEKGEITAVKGGGSCRVTATDPATGEMIYWDITTTTVGNPDTLDKNSIAIFSIAGAAMAGLGSMIARIKRFGRR